MPFLIPLIAAMSTGALVFDRVTDDVEDKGQNLLVIGLAGVALYGAYVAISKGKIF